MKIRLNEEEIKIIKNFSKKIFGECEIYIFGSRLIDKKGGDIDIFIIPKKKENFLKKGLN